MQNCTNADILRRPKKRDKDILNNSEKMKTAQKGNGPRKALKILPDDTETTSS